MRTYFESDIMAFFIDKEDHTVISVLKRSEVLKICNWFFFLLKKKICVSGLNCLTVFKKWFEVQERYLNN